jgi:hypothetical protein
MLMIRSREYLQRRYPYLYAWLLYYSSPRDLTCVFIEHNGMGLFGVKKKIYIALGVEENVQPF